MQATTAVVLKVRLAISEKPRPTQTGSAHSHLFRVLSHIEFRFLFIYIA